jgi:YesN/AraC family two-component response regulator
VNDNSLFLKKPKIAFIKRILPPQQESFCIEEKITMVVPVANIDKFKLDGCSMGLKRSQVLLVQSDVVITLEEADCFIVYVENLHVDSPYQAKLIEGDYSIIELENDTDFFLSNLCYLEKIYVTEYKFAKEELLESISSVLLLVLLDKTEEPMNTISEITQKAQRYIEKHYKDEVTLTMLAEKLNFSVYYLSHIFKKEMGCAPMQYLMIVRMEKAKELLRLTNDTIFDIAQKVGYSNGNYFNMLFKRVVGITPRKYRKNYRKSPK